jgi:hypothetical protein
MAGDFYAKKQCRHCHEPISENAINRHEKNCVKLSPEQREKQKRARAYAQHRPAPNGTVVSAKMERARGAVTKRHPRGLFADGKGRRLYATISIDFKTLRTLILDLAPSISIDKVEVL